MLTRDVAPGIHRVEDAHTNWYLVEDDGSLGIVDAGVPQTSWTLLHDALRQLGLPVLVHRDDVHLTREAPRLQTGAHAPLLRPDEAARVPDRRGLLRRRAFWPTPIAQVTPYVDGTLDVPGRPHVVFTPGHTLATARSLTRSATR